MAILITLDSNERGSERAKALALAVGGDPAYELAGFAELRNYRAQTKEE